LLQNFCGSEEYRQAFVEEKIRTGLAAQIKTIREKWQGGMKQAEFAKRIEKSQSWVSRLEDPNAPIPTVPTLLLIADTFDIGLKVCFVPFSELLDDAANLSPDALYVPAFREDQRLFPRKGPRAERNVTELRFTGTHRRMSLDETEAHIPGEIVSHMYIGSEGRLVQNG
jgi:transcriptional regulator with XRE-family HTH domain